MDFLIGRNLTKNVIISLEIGVPIIKDYPVYDFKNGHAAQCKILIAMAPCSTMPDQVRRCIFGMYASSHRFE